MDALWEHDREAVTPQRTPRGLCASTIELSLRLYCNYALLVLEDANGALVAMLKTLWRCHGDPISFLLCVYQNAERAMCMLKVRAVPWRSRRSTATKRTPLRCRTLLREPWRFPFFRTQQECLGDAAPVWQRFYLVGFLWDNWPVIRELDLTCLCLIDIVWYLINTCSDYADLQCILSFVSRLWLELWQSNFGKWQMPMPTIIDITNDKKKRNF